MENIFNINPKNPTLFETTTPVQAKRGNRQFYDTHHKVSYITYANGYVRREVKSIYTSSYSGLKYKCQDQFVINNRSYEKKSWTNFKGQIYNYTQASIIKEPCPQKRMDIIDRISSNYKGYKGRFTNPGHTLISK